MSIEINLDRVDRIYRAGESVTGSVLITTPTPLPHAGLRLVVEGSVTRQLSARSIGLFEAFYSSLKPLQLLHIEIDLDTQRTQGRLPAGTTAFPFFFSAAADFRSAAPRDLSWCVCDGELYGDSRFAARFDGEEYPEAARVIYRISSR